MACYSLGFLHLCSVCFLVTEAATLAQMNDSELVLNLKQWQAPSTPEKRKKKLQKTSNRQLRKAVLGKFLLDFH